MLEPAPLDPSPLQEVGAESDVADALAWAMPVPPPGRALLLVGGADFTDPELLETVRGFFANLAAHCARTSTAVVDGGTDTGVMRLIADARAEGGGSFPLVGVAPRGAFARLTSAGAPISPAPGHSIILLTPGSAFGDETEWLFLAADHLAGGSAPAVVVNGGRLSLHEARLRLDRGATVVAAAGSGRAADDLAADEALRASGRLRVIPIDADEATIAAALEVEDRG